MAAIPPSILIVVAGGSSRRMGAERPKQFLEIDGRSLLLRSLDAFANFDWIAQRIVVLPPDVVQDMAEHTRPGADSLELASLPSPNALAKDLFSCGVDLVACGGARRQDSVLAGLTASTVTAELVLIHDAARAFVTTDLIQRVAEAAAEHGGAIPTLPLNDTVKVVDNAGLVKTTLERSSLRRVQTPQAFRMTDLLAAYRRYNATDVTDDAAMYELASRPVVVVEGDEDNIKVTSPGDLERANAILNRRDKETQHGQ